MEQTDFTLVEMAEYYPFAALANQPSTALPPLVRRILPSSHPNHPENAVQFLRTLQHPHLVNLVHSQELPHAAQILYQYVPFKLERWITDVDENILDALQEQLLSLAEYLTRGSINFRFHPEQLGLDENMAIKFFLGEFSVDMESYDQNYQALATEIELHFEKLKKQWNCPKKPTSKSLLKSCSVELEAEPKQQSGSKIEKGWADSVATNSSENSSLNRSLSHIREKYKERSKLASKSSLSEQVANSMKKSLEVLTKFKRIGANFNT